jgi:hypothetical protein
VKVESRSDTPQGSWRRVEWQYDALGRRIRQTTWSWLVQSNLWVVTEDLKFVSDALLFGRHLVDLNGSNNVPVRSYVWGLDLSETLEGAGGVGGLLWVTLHTCSNAGTHFCVYDFNDLEVWPLGLPGQNMNPPAEKRFNYHRIVRRGLMGNEYYDPAYGITTTGPKDYAPKIDAWARSYYSPERGVHPRYRKAEGSGLLPRFVP